jgi:hypothetical protein
MVVHPGDFEEIINREMRMYPPTVCLPSRALTGEKNGKLSTSFTNWPAFCEFLVIRLTESGDRTATNNVK